jgi:hypothetical protein
MLIIRRYRKTRNGSGGLWEYKIHYIDPFSKKIKVKRKGGFRNRDEAEGAAHELMTYLF